MLHGIVKGENCRSQRFTLNSSLSGFHNVMFLLFRTSTLIINLTIKTDCDRSKNYISEFVFERSFQLYNFFLPPQSVSLIKFMVKVGPRETRAHYILEWREYLVEDLYCSLSCVEHRVWFLDCSCSWAEQKATKCIPAKKKGTKFPKIQLGAQAHLLPVRNKIKTNTKKIQKKS